MIDLPCLIYTPCSVPIMSHGIHVQDSWQGGVRVCGHGPEQSLPTHSEPGPMTHVSLAPCSKQLSCHKNQQWLKPFRLQVKQIRLVWQPIVQAATRDFPKVPKNQWWGRITRVLAVLVLGSPHCPPKQGWIWKGSKNIIGKSNFNIPSIQCMFM